MPSSRTNRNGLLLRFRLQRGFLEGLAERESGHLRRRFGRDLDLLARERIPPHVCRPRRSHPDEHLAHLAECDPFAAHDAVTDDLEQIFQELLNFLAGKAVLLRKIFDYRCARELVRGLSRRSFC